MTYIKPRLFAPFSKGAGFTLIEILIVMVIISIVSGIALLTISKNPHKQIENVAHQLTQLILLAEEEAMLRPATIGLALSPTHYQFLRYKSSTQPDESAWQPLESNHFKRHTLPANLYFSLIVQHQAASLSQKAPPIIISESGDITPFTIFIRLNDEAPYYRIIGKANGEIKSEIMEDEQ